MRQKIAKLLSVLAALSLFTGCAVWTGGVPASYSGKGKYPIIASVHGIKEVSYTNSLTQIVITYIPTNVITLDTNTTHGFRIQIQPAQESLFCTEYYVLPKPAQWGTKERPVWGRISLDKTTCRRVVVIPKGATYISDGWGMCSDDPIGEYRIVVFLGDKLAADFRFSVIDSPKAAAVSNEQNQ